MLFHLSHLVHLMSSHLMRNKSSIEESYFLADSSIVSPHKTQINDIWKTSKSLLCLWNLELTKLFLFIIWKLAVISKNRQFWGLKFLPRIFFLFRKLESFKTIWNTLLNSFPDGTSRFVVVAVILVWWFQVRYILKNNST